MEPLIYSNETVRAHSLYPACRSWLNVVSDRDYPGKNYFDKRIECLDMDLYEKDIQHKAQADHTVDTVIGIQTYKDNRATSGRLLLVEFRMGYESTNNLSKTEMERKAIYTKALLGGEIMINQQSIFIFNDAFAPLAKNWFNRQQKTGGDFKDCESCSVTEFNNNIKSLSDFPYVPYYSAQVILDSLCPEQATCYIEQMRFWCGKARDLFYKNSLEYNHLQGIIQQEWTSFRNGHQNLTDDEELIAEILEEDFSFIFN